MGNAKRASKEATKLLRNAWKAFHMAKTLDYGIEEGDDKLVQSVGMELTCFLDVDIDDNETLGSTLDTLSWIASDEADRAEQRLQRKAQTHNPEVIENVIITGYGWDGAPYIDLAWRSPKIAGKTQMTLKGKASLQHFSSGQAPCFKMHEWGRLVYKTDDKSGEYYFEKY
jgi:hypothetical protein